MFLARLLSLDSESFLSRLASLFRPEDTDVRPVSASRKSFEPRHGASVSGKRAPVESLSGSHRRADALPRSRSVPCELWIGMKWRRRRSGSRLNGNGTAHALFTSSHFRAENRIPLFLKMLLYRRHLCVTHPRRHGRACHRKSAVADLRHFISAEVGQARLPMPSTTCFLGKGRRGCPAQGRA